MQGLQLEDQITAKSFEMQVKFDNQVETTNKNPISDYNFLILCTLFSDLWYEGH